MTYPVYPEYKDSGVEWLDKVPAPWVKAPIKYTATEKNSLFIDGDWIESKDLADEGIRYITTGNVGEGKYKEQGTGYISEEKFHELDCTEVFRDDLLISRLNAPIGRSCIVPDLGRRVVTSVDNVIYRPNKRYSRKFLMYLFSSKDYFSHTGNLARGATMQRISRGLLGNIRILTPPTLDKQTQIATFLDCETQKIDRLIEKQQQLIKLLQEKRQAVISHAVTKGLNHNAKMKDSGVEWLGEIPEYWEVKKLKYVIDFIMTGTTPDTGNKDYFDGGVDWFNPKDLNDEVLERSIRTVSEKAVKNRVVKLFPKDSILVVGIGATTGKTSYLTVEATFNQQITGFHSFSGNNRFLFFLLKSLAVTFLNIANYTTLPILNNDFFKSFVLVFPDGDEQSEISDYLGVSTGNIDRLIEKCREAILLSKERRTALISAAVTGKIDVRNITMDNADKVTIKQNAATV